MAKKLTCGRCGAQTVAGAPMKRHRKSEKCISFGLVLFGQVRPPKFIPAQKYERSRGKRSAYSGHWQQCWYVTHEVKFLLKVYEIVRSVLEYGLRYRRDYPVVANFWWRGRLLNVMWRRAKKDPSWLAALQAQARLSDRGGEPLFFFLEETLWGVLR